MIIHSKGDIVEIKGSLNENQWLALRSVIALALRQHPNGIVVDGSGLTEITESGIATFLDASNYIQASSARLVIAGLSDEILAEVRRMPGARSQLPIVASVEEARASLEVGGAEAIPEEKRKPSVLVPLVGDWGSAIEFAAFQAGRKAEIHLLKAIEVPRTMAIGVPLPEQEKDAVQALTLAEEAVRRYKIPARKLTVRARVAGDGIVKFARDTMPRLTLVAYPAADVLQDLEALSTVGSICHADMGDSMLLCVAETPQDPEMSPPPRNNAIIVPLVSAWPRALEYAAVQAAAWRAELHLLYVMEVPRTERLDVSHPNLEREAEQTLSEAESSIRQKGLVVRKMTAKARNALEGAAKYAAAERPALLLAAFPHTQLIDEGRRSNIIGILCHNAEHDIAICCISG